MIKDLIVIFKKTRQINKSIFTQWKIPRYKEVQRDNFTKCQFKKPSFSKIMFIKTFVP